MSAVKVKKDHFTGAGKVFEVTDDGLAAIVRGALIDNARNKVGAKNIAALVDNTTGVSAGALVDLVVPTAKFDASAAGGAALTAWNTALGKIANAHKVLTNSVNRVRTPLGLPAITTAFGTEAAADTLPAQDVTTGAAATGVNALDFAGGAADMNTVKANQRILAHAVNECLTALGETPVATAYTPSTGAIGTVLTDPGTSPASADGTSAIAKTVADAFLAASAANLASIATKWNAVFDGSAFVTDAPLHAVAG